MVIHLVDMKIYIGMSGVNYYFPLATIIIPDLASCPPEGGQENFFQSANLLQSFFSIIRHRGDFLLNPSFLGSTPDIKYHGKMRCRASTKQGIAVILSLHDEHAIILLLPMNLWLLDDSEHTPGGSWEC